MRASANAPGESRLEIETEMTKWREAGNSLLCVRTCRPNRVQDLNEKANISTTMMQDRPVTITGVFRPFYLFLSLSFSRIWVSTKFY